MSVQNEKLLQNLKWRYATKRFDSTKKISSQDWDTLTEALRLSPSSFGLQPWKFQVIQNPELRKSLMAASWNQSQVVDCSHMIVFTSLTNISVDYVDHFIQQAQKARNTTLEALSGYRQVILNFVQNGPVSANIQGWTQRQSYIALGNLIAAAANLHIDTCPMEGIDAHQYDQILGLEKTDYRTMAAICLGYRHPEDAYQHYPKIRFGKDEIFELR